MEFDYTLLVKYILDDLTEPEMESLMEWRDESSDNRELFSFLVHLRVMSLYRDINSSGCTLEALNRINRKIEKKKPLLLARKSMRYTASLLLVLSIFFGTVKYFSRQKPDTSFTVSMGESIKKFHLPDGTIVWLNEGATMKIPHSFSEKNRNVKIEGEAYFDVKKDMDSPFLVDATSMRIKVMGTSFSLKNKPETGVVETVLVSGKVLLLNEEGNRMYEMYPGEKVIYSSENNEYQVKTVDTNVSTAWHLDQLTFENITLREIANKLSLIYDVNINLESKKMADRKYRCVINRDETLEQVLDILSYLAPIKYKIEGDEVFIYE